MISVKFSWLLILVTTEISNLNPLKNLHSKSSADLFLMRWDTQDHADHEFSDAKHIQRQVHTTIPYLKRQETKIYAHMCTCEYVSSFCYHAQSGRRPASQQTRKRTLLQRVNGEQFLSAQGNSSRCRSTRSGSAASLLAYTHTARPELQGQGHERTVMSDCSGLVWILPGLQ